MSHIILIEALKFYAPDRWYRADFRTPTLFVTQRHLFNSLAPIVPRETELCSVRPATFFRLLMRADTFRFATSLRISETMNNDLVREILSKMVDFVVEIDIDSSQVTDVELTPTLLALPHLEILKIRSWSIRGTYHEVLKPMLRHPRESVRRSVAQSAERLSPYLQRLETEQFVDAVREDIIPLIDSGSNNGAVLDYLRFTWCASGSWVSLSQDTIMMLGDRFFQYFTASNAHVELVELSLRLLNQLAVDSMTRRRMNNVPFDVDVFEQWPVLEHLPGMLQCGTLSTYSCNSVIANIFLAGESMQHHQQRVFELGLPDMMHIAHFVEMQLSPFLLGSSTAIEAIAQENKVSLLTKTSVLEFEMRLSLIPFHRDVATHLVRLQRQGEAAVTRRHLESLAHVSWFGLRTGVINFIFQFLILPELESLSLDPSEESRVLHLLLSENEGLHLGPILRSYFLLAPHWPAAAHLAARFARTCVEDCRRILGLNESTAPDDDSGRRRGRHDVWMIDERLRGYLYELMDIFESTG